MFNFFKKKEEPSNQQLENFQEEYTLEQRAAIIGSLVKMAQSDGETHPKELQFVEQARKLLGVELDDPVIADILQGDEEAMTGLLKSLGQSQKEWLIAALHSVILADGKVEESETSFIVNFCAEIGISEFDYLVITNR